VQARRRRRDQLEAERGGEAGGVVVHDQHVDIGRMRRRVDARAVEIDKRPRIGDRTDSCEDAIGGRSHSARVRYGVHTAPTGWSIV
jgi:hypothetical protein